MKTMRFTALLSAADSAQIAEWSSTYALAVLMDAIYQLLAINSTPFTD